MENEIKTYSTTDYSIFKRMNGNRSINKNNVKNIIKNIQESGLKPSIIIVNEKMEVIDGQHRLEALRFLGLPVNYQIWEGLTLKDCVALNISAKKWTFLDYAKSYADMGLEDYIDLLEFCEEYPNLSLSCIATVLSKSSYGGKITSLITSGDFRITESKSKCFTQLNIISDLVNQTKLVRGRREVLVTTLSRIIELENVDVDRLSEQLEKYSNSKLLTIVDTKDCVEKIEEIYNYNKKHKYYFSSDYKNKYGCK